MTKNKRKEKIVSFLWQHALLLVSLNLMALGVVFCVKSCLGSSVISSLPFVFSQAGAVGKVPGWTIGGYTIAMNFVLVFCQILILRKVRPHATVPIGHRLCLRLAHRPEHVPDICFGVHGSAIANARPVSGMHRHGHRHRLRGEMRLGDHAGRRHLDCHQPSLRPPLCQGQNRGGHGARVARHHRMLPLFREMVVECHRAWNAVCHGLCGTGGKVHRPTYQVVRPSAGLQSGVPALPVRTGKAGLPHAAMKPDKSNPSSCHDSPQSESCGRNPRHSSP